jgi:hypothetical protein
MSLLGPGGRPDSDVGQCSLVGSIGCFSRGDRLQGPHRSTRRSSPWIPPTRPWARSASTSTSARKSSRSPALARTAKLLFVARSSGLRGGYLQRAGILRDRHGRHASAHALQAVPCVSSVARKFSDHVEPQWIGTLRCDPAAAISIKTPIGCQILHRITTNWVRF